MVASQLVKGKRTVVYGSSATQTQKRQDDQGVCEVVTHVQHMVEMGMRIYRSNCVLGEYMA